MNPATVWLTLEQLVEWLQTQGMPVTQSTVYAWTARRGPDAVPTYRAGRHLVVEREEFLAWYRQQQKRMPALPRRVRRVPVQRPRRAAPDRLLEGQGAKKAVRTGLSANGEA